MRLDQTVVDSLINTGKQEISMKQASLAKGTDKIIALDRVIPQVPSGLFLSITDVLPSFNNPLLCAENREEPFSYISSFIPNSNHTRDALIPPCIRWQNRLRKI